MASESKCHSCPLGDHTVLPTQRLLLAFSPHLDDAVLSIGAAIAARIEQGWRVVVCTLFAGDPVLPVPPGAAAFHRNCGLGADPVAQRRQEDLAALAELGAQPRHLGFPDAIYRWIGDRPLHDRPGAVLDPGLPPEDALRADLRTAIAEVLTELDPAEVWTCAGIGGHVDHRHTTELVRQECAHQGRPLSLWTDLPYAPADPALTRPAAAHLARKLAAAAHYRSQLPVLFPDGADWRAALRTAEYLRAAERLTTAPAAGAGTSGT